MKPIAIPVARSCLAALILLVLGACDSGPQEAPGPVREVDEPGALAPYANPLLEDQGAAAGSPPFHQIRAEHFLPALETATAEAESAIAEIVADEREPDFDNTIAALERAEADVARIARTWRALKTVTDGREMRELAADFSGLLAQHETVVAGNRLLFERVETVATGIPKRPLTTEQRRMIEITRQRLRNAGAGLNTEDLDRLREIDRRLETRQTEYLQAWQEHTDAYELLIDDEAALAALPDSLVRLAERNARRRGHARGWLFTLDTHSFLPFMRHFPVRERRRELYRAWLTRSQNSAGELVEHAARLRAERARLLGHESHLDLLLSGSVIDRERLEALLEELAVAARARAPEELDGLQSLAAEDGIDGELEPWDWWYYRQRALEAALERNGDSLRDWFELEQVREGLFALGNRLWGLSFHPRSDLPAWHSSVSAFEVRDLMGETLGLLFFDLLDRPEKPGGTWTSHYRVQHRRDGERITPVSAVVANLPPAAAGLPSLLEPEQAVGLFHEFGHALQAMLSDVGHTTVTGTDLPPGFAEFPALLLEQWAFQPQVLQTYAWHHETGNLIDDAAIEALRLERELIAGLDTLERVAALEFDLVMHGRALDRIVDPETAGQAISERLRMPALLSPGRFVHGPAGLLMQSRHAGGLPTLHSELLAADAFAAFREFGALNRELAERLRKEILALGNARDPLASWQAFRGRSPRLQHLLEANSLEPVRE